MLIEIFTTLVFVYLAAGMAMIIWAFQMNRFNVFKTAYEKYGMLNFIVGFMCGILVFVVGWPFFINHEVQKIKKDGV